MTASSHWNMITGKPFASAMNKRSLCRSEVHELRRVKRSMFFAIDRPYLKMAQRFAEIPQKAASFVPTGLISLSLQLTV